MEFSSGLPKAYQMPVVQSALGIAQDPAEIVDLPNPVQITKQSRRKRGMGS